MRFHRGGPRPWCPRIIKTRTVIHGLAFHGVARWRDPLRYSLPTARSERAFSLHGLASSGVSCAGTELNASLWLGGDNRLRCLSAGSAALLPPYKGGVRSRAELTDRWLNSSCRACR